jgi:2,4-dienoyl-CoA reductase-like NADH-dependent reductase (Old Yellow Enzyme family)
MTTFPKLFEPLTIGPVTSRNRIVCGAHFTQFSEPARVAGEPGRYGARYARYLADRAKGGAGVIIAGQAQVHPTTAYQMPNNAAAWPADAAEGFREVTDAVHEHGALAFIQLAHNGGVNDGTWSKLPVWSPSGFSAYNEPGVPLDQAMIDELVAAFATSAANAAAGGFDGIEVHGAHGYLIHEFLSPKSNARDDGYGGSLENRMRFVVEVLTAVRDAVGPAVAVGLRLVGDEEQWDGSGLGADDAGEIAARLEALGLVDFLNVSVGTSGMGMVRPLYSRHLLGVYAASTVKHAVESTPVFAVHRILTPEEAEGVLERGEADAVTVVRALIADPEWGIKAAAGRADEIRPCTGCNQGCYGNLLASVPVTCTTNPAVGRDAELGLDTLVPATTPGRFVVVGGGPAGLEAAWVAAARGHEVVLLERSDRLGGKVHLAASMPGRAELAGFVTWRIDECARQGVDVRLGVDASAAVVIALYPTAVVVATGARATTDGHSKWHPFPISGSDQAWVLDHEQALVDPERCGARVIVLDAVGHIEAIGLGEVLAAAGRDVTVLCPLPTPMLLDPETMSRALPRMVRAGARWRPNTVLAAIGDHDVTVVDTLARELETITGVDTVVIRTHGTAVDGLYHELADGPVRVHRIGDALAARWVDRAVMDGHLVGRAL